MLAGFKRKLLGKYVPIVKPVIIYGIFFVLLLSLFQALIPIYRFSKENNLSGAFLWSLITSKKSNVSSYHNRTNVALFGVAGGTHDGAQLTDSIMVISIDFQKKDALLVSVPRDIYLESLKDKINSAYAYGQARKEGGGLVLSKASVEEVFGQPIHFAWLVDFSGFTGLIDLVGGIDVNVETAFEDKEYPIEGKENDTCGGDLQFACRYEHLVFEKGVQHMDGKRALEFVRSRRAQGDEGTDFARGRRQQVILLALKEKIFHSSFLYNPRNMQKLIKSIDEMTTTDMKWGEILTMIKAYLVEAKDMPLRHVALDWGNPQENKKGFLINPPAWQYKDSWVLVPRTGDFDEIHTFITCQTESVSCTMKP